MANRDRTGPSGAGPRTGRGLGSCSTKAGTKAKSSVRGLRGGNRRRGKR